MRQSERDMLEFMKAVERDLDKEFAPQEEALRMRAAERIRSAQNIFASVPDSEAPQAAWDAFVHPGKLGLVQDVGKSAVEGSYEDFFQTDPVLSPQVAI